MPAAETLSWIGNEAGHLDLIDQTRLPTELVTTSCHTVEDVWQAIKQLKVRGAPAIGIAAAYGICVAIRDLDVQTTSVDQLRSKVQQAAEYLATSRPTAVNLFWALNQMTESVNQTADDTTASRKALLSMAKRIHDDDRRMCHAIGSNGAPLIQSAAGVITHCNAGGLATSEYGTALSVLFTAHDLGGNFTVYVDETRPLLQGSRLTAWELMQHGVPTKLICDNMAAHVMSQGFVQAVITGADRIAANGDTANKIGTYGLAVLARHHDIPFYVAAPSNTFDLALKSGGEIPIEQRDPVEVTNGMGRQTAPDDVSVYNPAFDVTPAELITAIVTERGVIDPVTQATIQDLIADPSIT